MCILYINNLFYKNNLNSKFLNPIVKLFSCSVNKMANTANAFTVDARVNSTTNLAVGTLNVAGNAVIAGAATILSPVNHLPTTFLLTEAAAAAGAGVVLTTANAPSGTIIRSTVDGTGSSNLTLPPGTPGYNLLYIQTVTQAGANDLVISCNGTETFQLGSVVGGGNVTGPVATQIATGANTTLTITFAAAAAFDLGSTISFNCLATGVWLCVVNQSIKGAGTTVSCVFST